MNAPRWTSNAQAILALVLLIAFSFSSHPVLLAPLYSPSHASSYAARRSPAIALPAGSGIPLALVRPLLAATAAPGTSVHARTAFPVVSRGRVAGPPFVLPDGKFRSFTQSFRIAAPLRVSGKLLSAGNYEAEWTGTGPNVIVEMNREGKLAAIAKARLVFLVSARKAVCLKTRKGPDGSASLLSLYPAGKNMALVFEN